MWYKYIPTEYNTVKICSITYIIIIQLYYNIDIQF